MAYDAPTPANLKTRFPAFAAVDTAVVQGALDEAARRVDTTWTEGDFALARELYAAHVMITDGLGTSAEASAMLDGYGIYKKRQAGGSAIEFGSGSGGVGTMLGDLMATSYGRRFLELQRLNVGGPLVV